MLNNTLVQIALALLFVFLAMSAIVSMVQQFIVQGMRMRARTLRGCITKLLSDDVYKDQIVNRFYRHPMTMALSGGRSEPTQIEGDTFVLALASAVQPSWSTGDSVESLPASVSAMKDGPLKQRLALIMPPAGANRDLICNNVKAWFGSAEQKMSERYKADNMALSYGVALFATVFLNVSAVEIVNRLRSDDQFRAAFASAVPELAGHVYALSGSAEAAASAPTNAALVSSETGGESSQPAAPRLSLQQTGTMYTIFRCTESRIDLPVGWPWMADVVSRLNKVSGPQQQDPCREAMDAAEQDGMLKVQLSEFQQRVPRTVAGAAKSGPLYGASFDRNGILEVLLGWLITMVAAAQGAPFWFNAIRKIVGR